MSWRFSFWTRLKILWRCLQLPLLYARHKIFSLVQNECVSNQCSRVSKMYDDCWLLLGASAILIYLRGLYLWHAHCWRCFKMSFFTLLFLLHVPVEFLAPKSSGTWLSWKPCATAKLVSITSIQSFPFGSLAVPITSRQSSRWIRGSPEFLPVKSFWR